MKDYFKYRFSSEFDFNLDEGDFVTVVGNNNDLIIHTLLHGNNKCNIFVGDIEHNSKNMDEIRKRIGFVLYKHLNIFVAETVRDEIVFGLESLAMSKDDMTQLVLSESRLFKLDNLLERDPNSLGSSDKVKMKILISIIMNPKILVIDNILCELDYKDKLLVFDILKEYAKKGMIIINFTNDIEESLFGEKIIVVYDKKLICEGKTMSVLNEEKKLKRLNIGLPFMIELSKYFMDYGMINKYYLTNEKLIGAIWK